MPVRVVCVVRGCFEEEIYREVEEVEEVKKKREEREKPWTSRTERTFLVSNLYVAHVGLCLSALSVLSVVCFEFGITACPAGVWAFAFFGFFF
ncbi:MAG: hypothetical protein LBL44_11675 [Treponema sp.]|nr:hypothetical protein [Treponema sp.]